MKLKTLGSTCHSKYNQESTEIFQFLLFFELDERQREEMAKSAYVKFFNLHQVHFHHLTDPWIAHIYW